MNGFRLALRLLWRDGRSGELTILLCALVIAVSCSTTITLFADRLQRTMTLQAAEFLAADLVVSSSSFIPKTWLQYASGLQLQQSQSVEFPSVLIEHDEMLLTSVKAVTTSYPLRGYLKVSASGSDNTQERTVHQPPPVGEVWVERRVLSALKLKLGDTVTVGEKPLKVSQILLYEPDKQGDFYTMTPRILINQHDLAATQAIQPGSRVRYLFQFAGSEQNIKQFNQWLKPQLNPAQRLLDIHDDRREVGDALSRAERYLGLTSIVVILIAGVAIAMTTRRYSERHFNTAAILRCLGCTQKQILILFSGQFLVLGIVGSGLGCIIGWLAQQGLFYLLQSLLPKQLASPTLLAVFFGFLTGLAILFGFALPPLLRLKKVPALRVLRRELEPLPISAWLVYGLAFSLTAVLIVAYTQDAKMTGIILGGGLLLLAVTGGLIYLALLQTRKLLPHLMLGWRFVLQALLRNLQISVSQILAFSLTLVAMIISFTVRTDVLNDWKKQLPVNAPNHFAVNIFPHQLNEFTRYLEMNKIQRSDIYPVVSGRLTAINNVAVQQIVSKETQGERAIRRDLSLTWSANLPVDNKLVAGNWWSSQAKQSLVSIEEKLAKSLKVKLGNRLTFTIGNQQVNATVSSIRSLHWDTMKPNFYMIFSPGTLDGYPSTYLTSFYLQKSQKNLLNQLVKTYPNVTVLEVDLILAQLNTILSQLTAAINYVLYFALTAGFTVLFAAVNASLDQRVYESALMRTLGASRSLLRKTHVLEFSLLGLISGTLAVLISQILIWALYHWVLELDYWPNAWICSVVPLAGMLFVTAAGYWGIRNVTNRPPMVILRQQ